MFLETLMPVDTPCRQRARCSDGPWSFARFGHGWSLSIPAQGKLAALDLAKKIAQGAKPTARPPAAKRGSAPHRAAGPH